MDAKLKKQRRVVSKNVDLTMPASIVLNKAGGLTNFCNESGFATSTVHGWTVKGFIPSERFEMILELSKKHGWAIDPADFVPAPRQLAAVNG